MLVRVHEVQFKMSLSLAALEIFTQVEIAILQLATRTLASPHYTSNAFGQRDRLATDQSFSTAELCISGRTHEHLL